MGWASEAMIEEHNARMGCEAYAADYERAMDDAAEAEFFEWLLENEKFEEYFSDRLIDFNGASIELAPSVRMILIDDDLPF